MREAKDERDASAERSAAEIERCRQAEERYRALAESITEPFIGMDRNLRHTYWNKAAEQLTGVSASEALGKGLFELFPAMKGTKAEEAYQRALATGRPQRAETALKVDGRVLYLEIAVYPYAEGIYTHVRDVTERVEARLERERLLAEVEHQRAFLGMVVERVPAALAVLRGYDLVYELANPVYRSIVLQKDLIGRSIADVWPEGAADFMPVLRHVLETREPFHAVDVPLQFASGAQGALDEGYYTYSFTWLPPDASGRAAVLSTGFETTEQVRTRRQLERLAREAQAAVRARDEFLGAAAHELKTPITNLRGFAQVALRKLEREGAIDPQRLHHTLETLDLQSERLGRLVNQLLDLASIESGEFTLRRAEVDLSALIRDLVIRLQPGAPHHEMRLCVPPSIRADVDAGRVEQALANLLDNAVKFGPEDTPIDIKLATRNGTVLLSIRDYGPGIPAERRGQLFHRFYQAQAGRPFAGLGLGLYYARQIAERHGGAIKAEFPPEGGTRMVLELPAAVGGEEGRNHKDTKA